MGGEGHATDSATFSPRTTEAAAAREEILELEAQVRILSSKVTIAVDRNAELEEQLRHMRLRSGSAEPTSGAAATAHTVGGRTNGSIGAADSTYAVVEGGLRRMSTYFSRKSLPAIDTAVGGRGSDSGPLSASPVKSAGGVPMRASMSAGGDSDMAQDAWRLLEEERASRRRLEARYRQLEAETETLSATLFEQANEMVRRERQARSELETRLADLQSRQGEKDNRLKQLESALSRITRVRNLLVTA